MSEQADHIYQSFLVRCWLVQPATAVDPPVWRFELRDVAQKPQRKHFSDLEQMKSFLAEKLVALTESSKQYSDKADGQRGGEL